MCPPSSNSNTRILARLEPFSTFRLRCICCGSSRSSGESCKLVNRVLVFTLRYSSNLDPQRKNFVIRTRQTRHEKLRQTAVSISASRLAVGALTMCS